MDCLPDELVCEVLSRVKRVSDRNSVSQSCKRLKRLDDSQRKSIRVGCGLHPVHDALAVLCTRFSSLEKVEFVYSGWRPYLGKQLDNKGLLILSRNCPLLEDLTLSYCDFISNAGLGYLALCLRLSSFKLIYAPRINGSGILSLVSGCKNLSTLHLIQCYRVRSVEWLEYLGKQGRVEDLCIKNCWKLRRAQHTHYRGPRL